MAGEMVNIILCPYSSKSNIEGWLTFPEEYDYHRKIWVTPDLGIVLERSDEHIRVFLSKLAVAVWLSKEHVVSLKTDESSDHGNQETHQ